MNIIPQHKPAGVETTYDHLVQVLGQPGPGTDDGKTRVQWTVPTPWGEVHVYDWKKEEPIEQVTVWNVNGRTWDATEFVLQAIEQGDPVISDYCVTSDTFIATAELVRTYDRMGSVDLLQLERVLSSYPVGNVVHVLIQQLATAIRSPKTDVPDWADCEVDRTLEAIQDDMVEDINQKNAEMARLGIPPQYRARIRHWAAGAPVDEILAVMAEAEADGGVVVEAAWPSRARHIGDPDCDPCPGHPVR